MQLSAESKRGFGRYTVVNATSRSASARLVRSARANLYSEPDRGGDAKELYFKKNFDGPWWEIRLTYGRGSCGEADHSVSIFNLSGRRNWWWRYVLFLFLFDLM